MPRPSRPPRPRSHPAIDLDGDFPSEGFFKTFFATTFVLALITSIVIIVAVIVGLILLWRNFA